MASSGQENTTNTKNAESFETGLETDPETEISAKTGKSFVGQLDKILTRGRKTNQAQNAPIFRSKSAENAKNAPGGISQIVNQGVLGTAPLIPTTGLRGLGTPHEKYPSSNMVIVNINIL